MASTDIHHSFQLLHHQFHYIYFINSSCLLGDHACLALQIYFINRARKSLKPMFTQILSTNCPWINFLGLDQPDKTKLFPDKEFQLCQKNCLRIIQAYRLIFCLGKTKTNAKMPSTGDPAGLISHCLFDERMVSHYQEYSNEISSNARLLAVTQVYTLPNTHS